MIQLEGVSFEMRDTVTCELDPGETLQWVAQPRPMRFVLKSLPIFIFAIPWTAFAIFWVVMAAKGTFQLDEQSGGWKIFSFFPLFGLPFILIGLAMLSAPLWALRKAKRTVYAITDSRAILFEGGWGLKIRSFRPGQLQDLERNEHGNGWGDIILERNVTFDNENRRQTKEVGFFGIENVKAVEDMLESLQQKENSDRN